MPKNRKIAYATPLRRLAAFGIDWCVIAAYGLALFAVVVAANGEVPVVSAPYNALAYQLAGFVSLTLPVVVYFIAGEYHGGTLGKRIMRLRVTSLNSQRPGLWQVSARNIIKFLPWEMAHFCVHQFTASNLDGLEPSAVTMTSLAAVYGVIGIYLATLFFDKNHQAIYDRLSGTYVIVTTATNR